MIKKWSFQARTVFCISFFWLIFIILVRLLPHPAGSTPLFCTTLLLGLFFSRIQTILFGLFVFVFSDIILSGVYHFPMFGIWSFFTYSSFVVAFFLGAIFLNLFSLLNTFYAIISSTFLFWLLTNFGTWLSTTLYPKTMIGLFTCFIAGIPFLKNSLLGNLLWGMIIFSILHFYNNKAIKIISIATKEN